MLNFRTALLTASLTVLISATASMAADNDVTVNLGAFAERTSVRQSVQGSGNKLSADIGDVSATKNTKVSIDQVGEGNTLRTSINGSKSDLQLEQRGDGNQMGVISNGDANLVRAVQQGGSNVATLNQAGYGNRIVGTATGSSGTKFNDKAGVLQNGTGNKLDANQTGEHHFLRVGQVGGNNLGNVLQTERQTVVSLVQNGNGNRADLHNENSASDTPDAGLAVIQIGNNNKAKAHLGKGDSTRATIQQIGDGHIATLEANGGGNTLSILQNGTGETAHLNVSGFGNTAKLMQLEGSGNVINATIGRSGSEEGTVGNTMLITQNGVTNQTVNAGITGSMNTMDVNLATSGTTATYAMSGVGNTLVAR